MACSLTCLSGIYIFHIFFIILIFIQRLQEDAELRVPRVQKATLIQALCTDRIWKKSSKLSKKMSKFLKVKNSNEIVKIEVLCHGLFSPLFQNYLPRRISVGIVITDFKRPPRKTLWCIRQCCAERRRLFALQKNYRF